MYPRFGRVALLALALVPLSAAATAQSCNTADRSVLLILDASGSMNAALPSGDTRMQIARGAVKGVAEFLPDETQLALRLYGSQSHRDAHNCVDTNVAVPFGPASASIEAIAAAVDGATAQGYTPIAFSLGEAAGDFSAEATDRVIVLVSVGKETCDGDPTLAARALAEQGVTVHAVGFIVDTAARMQLQAVAQATGGLYFDAPVGPELPEMLQSALAACKQSVALPADPGPGLLETTSAIFPLPVVDAETGEPVGVLDRMSTRLELPAGVYEVQFGPGSWKGIEVRAGETTIIDPGVLEMEPTAAATVFDSETGLEFGSFNAVTSQLTLMPGVYDLKFGVAEWRYIKVDGGGTTTINPASIVLASELKFGSARVTTVDGTEVASFNAVTYRAILPPGDYIVEIDANKIPFPAKAGDVLEINPQ